MTFLRNNSLSRFAHNTEDAADLVRLVPNRRVGDVEVHVLWIAVPLDVEGTVFGEHCLAGLENAPQQRLKIVPQLLAQFNQIDGYRCLSLVRALAVVKCQSALA